MNEEEIKKASVPESSDLFKKAFLIILVISARSGVMKRMIDCGHTNIGISETVRVKVD